MERARVVSPSLQTESPTTAVAPDGRLEAYIERVAPEVIGVTYFFDPPASPPLQLVTLRVTGRRRGVLGRPAPRDTFTHDETRTGVVAGSGPVAITVKVPVTPGEWDVNAQARAVDARVLSPAGGATGANVPCPAPVDLPVSRARWSWLRWRISAASPAPVQTRLAPLVQSPAVLLGSWLVLVILGIVLALATQAALISTAGLGVHHVLVVSLPAIAAGAVGAKVWFIVLHRKDGRREGWAIQGLVAGVAVVAPLLLAVLHVPIGGFLDASAPGLMFGLAVGRVGCFFTGCCAGRPTARRWGVWSSNRSVGARRVPTQLMESSLALVAGLLALTVVLGPGVQQGTVFIAAVAGYTLIRQGILRLREERRQSRLGGPAVATSAAVALIAAVAAAVLG